MSKSFFTDTEQERILAAIKEAELNTSGEIRLHIEPYCIDDPYARATAVFEQLGMTKTAQKNGILFYLAYTDHKFAVVGDSGIHSFVSDAFWIEVKHTLEQHFKKAKIADGLCAGILLAGQKLKQYFPYQSDDVNELSDDISFGEHPHD